MDSQIYQNSPSIAPPVISAAPKQRAPTLYLIVAIKLLKGALLLVAAGVFFSLVGMDLQQQFNRLLMDANIDPEGKLFGDIGRWLQTVTPEHLQIFATGTVLYSAFSLVEGAGLWLRASWAGWMAIGESSFFIPIEIYELIERYSTTLLVILILNIWIVWYLYTNRHRLFRHHHHHSHPPSTG
jgi:uncharacterized membrane protein (DUF2068 family)